MSVAKKIIFLTFMLFGQSALAWTLVGQQGVAFKVKEVTINIASTSCTNAGFDTAALLNHVKNTIDKFWNKVAESSLELKIGSVGDINIDGQTSASAVATNLTPDNTILVGCNDDVTTFTDGFTGGIGSIYCNSSDVCRGAVIMNAHASSNVDTFSENEILTVLGHELGHALGLGHSSVTEALMYYSISNKTQEFLHQDDING
ncbi:MAG: matrixin family metalloprotease, partial [Bdellovibrionota bacterium]